MTEPGAVTVRRVSIGTGRPKICVPVLGKCEADILASADSARLCHPDVVEWRIDWFDGVEDAPRLANLLCQLKIKFDATPLLVTFRSSREGGEREISPDNYVNLLCNVISAGAPDLIDVELFSGEDAVRTVVTAAHQKGVAVIGSSHDFDRTPDEAELISRLERMQALGCDIAKIAVMPQSPRDVLTLLSATERMKREHPELPLITMSMGQLGMVSRLCGEIFGSALTFGSAGQASAPGQVEVSQLRQTLELLHNYE